MNASATRAIDSLRPWLDASPLFSFDRVGYRRHALGFRPDDLDVDLTGRRFIVTGANSGIGRATSLALAERGGHVVMLCRSEERGRAARDAIRSQTDNPDVSLVRLDVTDLGAVVDVAQRLGSSPVHGLVHSAGVLPAERVETNHGMELTYATHVAGPHLLTRGLRAALEAARGRVIFVSSGGMLTKRLNVDDPQWRSRAYDGLAAYAETKRTQVVLAELWARQLGDRGVSVSSMHPGWADTPAVRSSLPRFRAVMKSLLRTPTQAADTVVWLAASAEAATPNGAFFFDRRAVAKHWLPTTRATEADKQTLWTSLESITVATGSPIGA